MKILIAITTAETVYHETMESIYNLKRTPEMDITLKIIHSYDVANGRNKLVQIARSLNMDYIFFVDSDIILPPNALIDLIKHDLPIVNGIYVRKELASITKDNPWTILYRHEPQGMNKYNFGPFWMSQAELPEEGLVAIDAAGLGCTLIKMSVFDVLGGNDDWFVFVKEEAKIELGPYCIGEDLYFYRNCLRHDIQPYAESSVRCGHIGKLIFTLKDKQNVSRS